MKHEEQRGRDERRAEAPLLLLDAPHRAHNIKGTGAHNVVAAAIKMGENRRLFITGGQIGGKKLPVWARENTKLVTLTLTLTLTHMPMALLSS